MFFSQADDAQALWLFFLDLDVQHNRPAAQAQHPDLVEVKITCMKPDCLTREAGKQP